MDVLETIGFIGLNHWLIALAASALGIMIMFRISHQIRRILSVSRLIQGTNCLPAVHQLLPLLLECIDGRYPLPTNSSHP